MNTYVQTTQWRSIISWAKSSASISELESSLFCAALTDGDTDLECCGDLLKKLLLKFDVIS